MKRSHVYCGYTLLSLTLLKVEMLGLDVWYKKLPLAGTLLCGCV